jgi:hypothetical protein
MSKSETREAIKPRLGDRFDLFYDKHRDLIRWFDREEIAPMDAIMIMILTIRHALLTIAERNAPMRSTAPRLFPAC